MEVASLDPMMLFALMASGGVFALAGLWLMFRPMHGGGSTKIKVLGVEFESSSAGLLVFVVGAAFMATPLFVDSRTSATVEHPAAEKRAGVTPASSGTGAVGTLTPEVAAVSTSPARVFTAVGQEAEENDNVAAANEIEIGSVIHGEVQDADEDFFSFPLAANFFGEVKVNVTGNVYYRVYDDLGGRMDYRLSGPYSFRPEQTRYYIGIYTENRRASYTLTVASRPE